MSCEALSTRFEACQGRAKAAHERLVLYCKRYPIDYAAVTSCGVFESCVAFEQCVRLAGEAADPERREERLVGEIEDLEEALADGQYDDANEACEVLRQDLDPDPMALALCRRVPVIATRQLTRELEALRDGTATSHLRRCGELREYSQQVSNDAARATERLCKEVEGSIAARKALDEVKSLIDRHELRLPQGCERSVGLLSALGTEWARAALAEVLDHCYVRLGAAILAGHRSTCDYQVRKVLTAANRHNLTAAPLGSLLDDARKTCGR